MPLAVSRSPPRGQRHHTICTQKTQLPQWRLSSRQHPPALLQDTDGEGGDDRTTEGTGAVLVEECKNAIVVLPESTDTTTTRRRSDDSEYYGLTPSTGRMDHRGLSMGHANATSVASILWFWSRRRVLKERSNCPSADAAVAAEGVAKRTGSCP